MNQCTQAADEQSRSQIVHEGGIKPLVCMWVDTNMHTEVVRFIDRIVVML
jgi:hypothetical protein